MSKQTYEVVYFIPNASKVFSSIRAFLRSVRTRFSADELGEIQLYSWAEDNRLGVLFRFNFLLFRPSMLKFFDSWVEELHLQIHELECFSSKERKEIVERYANTATLSFVGDYQMTPALSEIELGFPKANEKRREPRIPVNLRVHFKAAKENGPAIASRLRVRLGASQSSIVGYADSISSLGMFIRERTDLPLRSRLQVVIELPDMGTNIKTIAEIVDIVTEEKAMSHQGEVIPGSGLRFLKFFEDGEQLLRTYLGNADSSSVDLLLE